MANKVALITGASRGIGLAVAEQLSAAGFQVVLVARNSAQLRDSVEQIRGAGGTAEIMVGDVRDSGFAIEAMNICEARYGRLDLLINNAGVGQFLPLSRTTDEVWSAAIDTNLSGAFYFCRAALPLFDLSGGGHIVNVASIAAVRGFSNNAAYSASKAGLVGLSRSMREELRGKHIRVSVVLPGATDTPFWDDVEGEWDRDRMIAPVHVARIITNLVLQPAELQVEEITIMPSGGAL